MAGKFPRNSVGFQNPGPVFPATLVNGVWVVNTSEVEFTDNVTVEGALTVDGLLTSGGILTQNILADQITAIVGGNPETIHQTSPIPAGWGGTITYWQLAEAGGLVFIDWSISIANGTVVTTGEVVAAIPPGYYYPADSKLIPGDFDGTYAGARISGSGMSWNNAGFTMSGTGFWYGQGIITTKAE